MCPAGLPHQASNQANGHSHCRRYPPAQECPMKRSLLNRQTILITFMLMLGAIGQLQFEVVLHRPFEERE